MKFSQLSIKENANASVRVALDGYTIHTASGSISLDGEYIDIVSAESNQMKDMDLFLKRQIALGVTYAPQDIDAMIRSSIVVGWSFEEECNQETRVALFKELPSAITNYIVKRAEELVKVKYSTPMSPSSATMQNENIGLVDQSTPAQAQASATATTMDSSGKAE